MPPISRWWQSVPTIAIRAPSAKTGRKARMSGMCCPVVGDDYVAVLPPVERQEVTALLRAAGPAVGHEHRRVLLLDERRSGKRLAQLRPVDSVDLAPGAVQENPAPQTPSPTGGKRGLLLLDAGQLPGRSHTQSDDLHRVARVGVGEALPVQRVET